MTDDPDSLILVHLRRIDQTIDRVADDISDFKIRMQNVEEGLAGVNRRLDGMEYRMDRVERRLDLVDVH